MTNELPKIEEDLSQDTFDVDVTAPSDEVSAGEEPLEVGSGDQELEEVIQEDQEALAEQEEAAASRYSVKRVVVLSGLAALGLASCVALYIGSKEHKNSAYQADYFIGKAKTLTFTQIEAKPGDELDVRSLKRLKAPQGPRDKRLGYAQADELLKSASKRGLDVTLSAQPSEDMREYAEGSGLYPPYAEKTQAGLRFVDRRERELVSTLFPKHVYADFHDIPKLATETIFFLENREMGSIKPPTFNYVLEWDRTAVSFWMLAKSKLTGSDVHGGSTLATQWEKFSHTPGGNTHGSEDKMRQIYSASIRLYGLNGENTESGRQRIALDYINQFPLGARPDLGEVHGLRDGFYAWYGLDPDEVDLALQGDKGVEAQGHALRHTIALFIALRRPSSLLAGKSPDLPIMIDEALGSMHKEKIIDKALYEATMSAKLEPIRQPHNPNPTPDESVRQKNINSFRAALAATLGMDSQHDLERLDLTARATLDHDTQLKVEQLLIDKMRDPAFLEENGFYREHGLKEDNVPTDAQYSFILLERDNDINHIRLEVDTLEKPFNFNRGARVDLGSTSKLRTLVTYLELVADLYDDWHELGKKELADLPIAPRDRIAYWVQHELYRNPKMTKAELLKEAVERKYPAYPARFMTGGGMHVFHNFSKDENVGRPDLQYATRKSINLPFIRLMQDLVWHYRWDVVGPEIISDKDHPKRQEYLERWASQDAAKYLEKYYSRYKGKESDDAIFAGLIERYREELTPSDYVALYTYFTPKMTLEEVRAQVDKEITERRRPILKEIDDDQWQSFYDRSKLGKLNLQDRGYVSEIHPLELWVAKELMKEPKVELGTLQERMTPKVLPQIYAWLLESDSKGKQDNKIYTVLEQDAFASIQRKWASMGYPFQDLVPSLATALGASGDRPLALSKLMGMIMSDGKQHPFSSIEEIYFGAGTPYAFKMSHQTTQSKQVLHPEVTSIVKEVMGLVVQRGTAVRARSLTEQPLFKDLVGKTGTGDHTLKHMTSSGRAVEGKAVSRAGVFMYGFGERYFGVLTVYVEGEKAENFEFTSSMAAQIFTHVAPLISEMIGNIEPEHHMKSEPTLTVSLDDEKLPNKLKGMALGQVIDPVLSDILEEEKGDSVYSETMSDDESVVNDESIPMDEAEESPRIVLRSDQGE